MRTNRQLLVIAIDGPAGSGKSTVASMVAQRIGATLLDSGAIYRTLALVARQQSVSWDDAEQLARLCGHIDLRFEFVDGQNRVWLGEEDISALIRTSDISAGASRVSRHEPVRTALLKKQRDYAHLGDVVAEGRDIGTVIFPNATLKFFLDADPHIRAERRHAERLNQAPEVDLETVIKEESARDDADRGRTIAPLIAASDAIVIDSTTMSVDDVVAVIMNHVQRASLE